MSQNWQTSKSVAECSAERGIRRQVAAFCAAVSVGNGLVVSFRGQTKPFAVNYQFNWLGLGIKQTNYETGGLTSS